MIDSNLGRVHVIGATGAMGKRIVKLLHEALAPEHVVSVSRSSSSFTDIASPETLSLDPGDVVIDAVGPYLHDPGAIVAHCLRIGAHYVDLSESSDFHELVESALTGHERHHAATSAVVPGCSTIPAMVDVLMPTQSGFKRDVLLSVGTQNEASGPLLYGLVRPLGHAHEGGRWWEESASRVLFDGSRRRYGSHPAPWEGSDTNFFCGLDFRVAYWILRVFSVVTRRMSDAALFKLCSAVVPLAKLFAVFGTPLGSLRLERRQASHHGDLVDVVEVRAYNQGLMVPALPAVWAALALLELSDAVGRKSLADLIDRSSVIADLRARGYTVETSLANLGT